MTTQRVQWDETASGTPEVETQTETETESSDSVEGRIPARRGALA